MLPPWSPIRSGENRKLDAKRAEVDSDCQEERPPTLAQSQPWPGALFPSHEPGLSVKRGLGFKLPRFSSLSGLKQSQPFRLRVGSTLTVPMAILAPGMRELKQEINN